MNNNLRIAQGQQLLTDFETFKETLDLSSESPEGRELIAMAELFHQMLAEYVRGGAR